MKIRANVTVRGLVQGVNFRYYTRQKAEGLNVTGWVKNLPDGSVRGCFEGEEEDVNALVGWCRTGPKSARVDAVEVEGTQCTGEFSSFEIKH